MRKRNRSNKNGSSTAKHPKMKWVVVVIVVPVVLPVLTGVVGQLITTHFGPNPTADSINDTLTNVVVSAIKDRSSESVNSGSKSEFIQPQSEISAFRKSMQTLQAKMIGIDNQSSGEPFAAIFSKATMGDAEAMFYLANCYYNGDGAEKDDPMAVAWWKKAAEKGNERAMFNLGVCYDIGIGVEKDERKVVAWWQKAAEKGNERAMNNLGVCYDQGTDVAKDERKTVEWWQKAAEKGHAGAWRLLRARQGRGEGRSQGGGGGRGRGEGAVGRGIEGEGDQVGEEGAAVRD